MKKFSLLAGVTALATLPFVAPASSLPCVQASVGTYTTSGFSCNVDGFLFSNITVSVTTSNGGSVALGQFTPFSSVINGVLESGLSLSYDANAPLPNSTADVAWSYTVTGLNGTLITDALLVLAGNTTGSGTVTVSEILTGVTTLSLNAPGSTTATFPPVGSIAVFKDQADHANTGTAQSSILTNAFSSVPGPIVGAGLPGLIAACAGLIGLSRRRRKIIA